MQAVVIATDGQGAGRQRRQQRRVQNLVNAYVVGDDDCNESFDWPTAGSLPAATHTLLHVTHCKSQAWVNRQHREEDIMSKEDATAN